MWSDYVLLPISLHLWHRHEKRCSVCMVKGPILCMFAKILTIHSLLTLFPRWKRGKTKRPSPSLSGLWGLNVYMGPLSKQLIFVDLLAFEMVEEEVMEGDTDSKTVVLAFSDTPPQRLSLNNAALCTDKAFVSTEVVICSQDQHSASSLWTETSPEAGLLLWLCMFVPHQAWKAFCVAVATGQVKSTATIKRLLWTDGEEREVSWYKKVPQKLMLSWRTNCCCISHK